MVFSAEQSAIIEAIQSEKNSKHEKVIITDSLSTIMAAESRTRTKKPKIQTIRKMLDHEGPRIALLWVPSAGRGFFFTDEVCQKSMSFLIKIKKNKKSSLWCHP
jgi:hypothetical protein